MSRPQISATARGERGQGLLVLTLLTAIIVADQAVKWWAWRHVSGAKINAGGDVLVGHAVGEWYDNSVTGALLDLLDFVLLSLAVSMLLRRRRPVAVAVSATLVLAGWASNLLDRLGMHYWTAPGSVRGVVDFIDVGGARYNIADLFIVAGTPLFLLVLLVAGCLRGRAKSRPAAIRAMTPAARGRPRARASMPALAGLSLIVVAVAFGAANYGGMKTAPAHASAKAPNARAATAEKRL
jgi:lipoprotein signal peptidase